jgi:hypothetical protein
MRSFPRIGDRLTFSTGIVAGVVVTSVPFHLTHG